MTVSRELAVEYEHGFRDSELTRMWSRSRSSFRAGNCCDAVATIELVACACTAADQGSPFARLLRRDAQVGTMGRAIECCEQGDKSALGGVSHDPDWLVDVRDRSLERTALRCWTCLPATCRPWSCAAASTAWLGPTRPCVTQRGLTATSTSWSPLMVPPHRSATSGSSSFWRICSAGRSIPSPTRRCGLSCFPSSNVRQFMSERDARHVASWACRC